MIQLHSNCLVFKTAEGLEIPCEVDALAVELVGKSLGPHDAEVLRNAALAVLYYYKNELGRESVSVAEFLESLEQVMEGFGLKVSSLPEQKTELLLPKTKQTGPLHIENRDMSAFASETETGCELVLFKMLREELQKCLHSSPQIIRFTGLRLFVKKFLGAKRWTPDCQQLNDQIVDFLRQTLLCNPSRSGCGLVVQ